MKRKTQEEIQKRRDILLAEVERHATPTTFITAEVLAESLGESPATVNADLRALRKAGRVDWLNESIQLARWFRRRKMWIVTSPKVEEKADKESPTQRVLSCGCVITPTARAHREGCRAFGFGYPKYDDT